MIAGDTDDYALCDSGVRASGAIVGSYRLLERLGSGGMGHVYLAEHTTLGRRVALKMLRSEYGCDPGTARRFFNEARAVSGIHHENLVEVTDFGEVGAEKYYVMELLDGPSLAELIKRGPIQPRQAAAIAIQICDALAAVHEAGIVHRDLKPSNVFVTRRNNGEVSVKLTDFGVAKVTNLETGESLQETTAYAILGTPEYMAPEQLSAMPVDARADIYSLGVVLYEMVTGRAPFVARSFGEFLIKHTTVDPPKPSGLQDLPWPIPPALEDLILFCLAKQAQDRPRRAVAVARRLHEIINALPPESSALPRLRSSRARSVFIAVAAVLLPASVFAVVSSAARSDSEQPAGPTTPVAAATERVPDAAIEPVASTAAAADETAARVSLTFASMPPGAVIFRDGADEPLGTTPLSITTERSSDPATFEFRLRSFRPERVTISLSEDADVRATLVKLPGRMPVQHQQAAAPQPKTQPRRLGRNGIINPFE